MTAIREELRHLVEELPEDQVPVVLALVRQVTAPDDAQEWPPAWFGIGHAGRGDIAARSGEILREEFGLR